MTGPVDRSLPVLAARNASGAVRAVWVNYASHSTVVGERNRVGGDWPGFANEALERAFPGAVAFTTLGAGADVRPEPAKLVGWMRANLESGSLPLAQLYGSLIAAEARRVLDDEAAVETLDGPVIARHSQIQLPLSKPNESKEHWERQAATITWPPGRCYARAMLKTLETRGALPTEVDFPFSVWTFGEGKLAVVFLAGEIVADYSIRLKGTSMLPGRPRLWVTGWANAMPGYIPTRQMLFEGGYEVYNSQIFYLQPSAYAPDVEDVLVRSVLKLVEVAADTEPSDLTARWNECSDAKGFHDALGFLCSSWRGFECTVDGMIYGAFEYTAQDMQDIREHCRLSCGLCAEASVAKYYLRAIATCPTDGGAHQGLIRALAALRIPKVTEFFELPTARQYLMIERRRGSAEI